MKLQQLFEEQEYWSDYPNRPTSKNFANSLKGELAEKFKISPARIKVRQFLPQIDHFRQRWSIRLNKKDADTADFMRSMMAKFLLADFRKHFNSAELHDSWVKTDSSGIELIFNLVKETK